MTITRYANIDADGGWLGFYSDDVSAPSSIPSSCVVISDADWKTWLGATSRYRWIDGALTPYTPPATVERTMAALNALLAAKEAAGVHFQATGATAPSLFPTDAGTQGKLTSAFVMAGAGLWIDGTPWLTLDGNPVAVPFTAADVQNLAKKAAAYVAGCVAQYAQLATEVAADPTTDITQGWPSNT